MDDFRAEMIQKECEAWACWNDLSEFEKEDVFMGYQNIFNAGAKWQAEQDNEELDSLKQQQEMFLNEHDENVKLHFENERLREALVELNQCGPGNGTDLIEWLKVYSISAEALRK